MRIFLIRHGEASHELTTTGQRQISAAADFLKSLELDLSKTIIITSKLPRAVESATIIQKAMGLAEPLQKSWLTNGVPESAFDGLAGFATEHSDLATIIAVSHAPKIERILSEFKFYRGVRNGSVHEIDFQTKMVTHLFPS